MNFENYIAKANGFLKDIAIEIGEPENKAKAGRVLRAVLYALRDRFTAEESIHFVAHLPILIKGIYVDGWHLTRLGEHTNCLSTLLMDVKSYGFNGKNGDFSNDDKSLAMIRAVLRVLKRYIRDGEIHHLKVLMPEQIKDVILN